MHMLTETPLTTLLTEAAALTDEDVEYYSAVPNEIEPGEEEVASVPEDCKRLFALAQKVEREKAVLKAEQSFEREDIDKTYRIQVLNARGQTLGVMFWYSLRTQLHLHATQMIGLRRGWKIVLLPSNEPMPGENPMEKLRGMGIHIQFGEAGEQV